MSIINIEGEIKYTLPTPLESRNLLINYIKEKPRSLGEIAEFEALNDLFFGFDLDVVDVISAGESSDIFKINSKGKILFLEQK